MPDENSSPSQTPQQHRFVNLVVDAQFGTDPAVIERIRRSADALRDRGIPTIWISMDNRSQLYPPTESWPSASPQTRSASQLEEGGLFGHAPGTSEEELRTFREHITQYGPRTDEAVFPKAFFDAFATPDSINHAGARQHYLNQQRPEHIGGIDNVFHGQTLLDYLKDMGVEQVTIMGGNADVCVTETAMGAARNGMQATILSDHIIRHTDQAGNNPPEQYENELRTLQDQTLNRPHELADYPTKDALSAGTMYSDVDKVAIRQNLHIDTFQNFISSVPTPHNIDQPSQQQQDRSLPTADQRMQQDRWQTEQRQRQRLVLDQPHSFIQGSYGETIHAPAGAHGVGGGAAIAMSAWGLYQNTKNQTSQTTLQQVESGTSAASGVAGVADGAISLVNGVTKAAPTVLETAAPYASRASVAGAIAIGAVGVVQGAVDGDATKMATSAGSVTGAFAGAESGTALGAAMAGPYGAVIGGAMGGIAGAMGFEAILNTKLRPIELTQEQKTFFAFVDGLPAKTDASMSPELKALVEAKANMAQAQATLDHAMQTIPPTNPGVARNALETAENSFTDRFEGLQKNGGLQKVVVELTERNHPELMQRATPPANNKPGENPTLVSATRSTEPEALKPRDDGRPPLGTVLAMTSPNTSPIMPDRKVAVPSGQSPAP